MKIPDDWTFKDLEVAKGFEAHVRATLPWYELVTGAVAHITRHYVPHKGRIYDIGASTGNIGRSLEQIIKVRNVEFIAIDNSEEMRNQYNAPGQLKTTDAITFEYEEFDVAICMLVLMFLPPEKRKQWLQQLLKKIKLGGAVIVVDKSDGPPGYLATVMHRLTIAGKVATGITSNDIIAKELALGGIQRPLPYRFIENISSNAQEFFRFGEFAGWVIEQPE